MKFRPLTADDVPYVCSLYREGAKSTSLDAAERALQELVSGSKGSGALVCEASPGEHLALIVAVPDVTPSTSRLQVLAVPAGAQGRRLAKTLLIELKRHLMQSGTHSLWIDAEEKAVRTFASIGAVELGAAPPAKGSSTSRVRMRLLIQPSALELESERLLIRDWKESDLERFHELNAHPEVNRYLPGPLSREDSGRLADKLAREISHRGFGYWAVAKKSPTTPAESFLGMVGIAPAGDLPAVRNRVGAPVLELAWRLHPDSWHQGYATEAAARCIEFAFGELACDELVCFTVPENQASLRVMEKLGFKRDPKGDFKHPKLPPEHPLSDHWLFRRKSSAPLEV